MRESSSRTQLWIRPEAHPPVISFLSGGSAKLGTGIRNRASSCRSSQELDATTEGGRRAEPWGLALVFGFWNGNVQNSTFALCQLHRLVFFMDQDVISAASSDQGNVLDFQARFDAPPHLVLFPCPTFVLPPPSSLLLFLGHHDFQFSGNQLPRNLFARVVSYRVKGPPKNAAFTSSSQCDSVSSIDGTQYARPFSSLASAVFSFRAGSSNTMS